MPSAPHLILIALPALLAAACADPQDLATADAKSPAEFATEDADTGVEIPETADAVALSDTETADSLGLEDDAGGEVAPTSDLPAEDEGPDVASIPDAQLDVSTEGVDGNETDYGDGADTDDTDDTDDGDDGATDSVADTPDDLEPTDLGAASCQGLVDGCWEVTTVTLPADNFYGEWLAVGPDGTVKVAGQQVAFGERELVLAAGETEWAQGGWSVPLGSGNVESFGYHPVPPSEEPQLLVRGATAPVWHYQYKLDGEVLCPLWTQQLYVHAPSIAFDGAGAMVVAADVNQSPGGVQVCSATPGIGLELYEVFPDSNSGEQSVHLRLTADGAPEVLKARPDGLVLYREGLDSWVPEDVYASDFGSTLPQMVAKNDGAVTHVALTLGKLFLAEEPHKQVVYVRVTDEGAESVLLVDASSDNLTAENYNVKVLDLAVHPDGAVWVMVASNPDPWNSYTIDVTLYRVGLDGDVGSWPLMTTKMFGALGRVGAMAFAPDGRLLHLVPDTLNFRTRLRTWTPIEP